MLLLDQAHTAVAKGKSFQTSPPPLDNDPEDPWKVQVAKAGPPKKHVWVSCHSDACVRGHTCWGGPQHHLLIVVQICSCLSCSTVHSVWLHVLQTKAGSDPAARAFVGLLVHSAAGEHRFCFSVESPSCLAASVFYWLLHCLVPQVSTAPRQCQTLQACMQPVSKISQQRTGSGTERQRQIS